MRWVNERSGAPICGFVEVGAAVGTSGDITHGERVVKAQRPVFLRIHLDLDLSFMVVGGT
jgi:hypothetical protein